MDILSTFLSCYGLSSCLTKNQNLEVTTPVIVFTTNRFVFRNSVTMATPRVPGDQKLFERVCYMLKLKVTKFQLPTPNGF